jgi:3-phenylpropionate/trans-cinnamate dioxygenase ferredoxin component
VSAAGERVGGLVDVAAAADVPEGGTLRVDVDDTPVCLVNLSGTVYAIHDTCTHALESMCGGWVEGDRIECPRHGSFFSVVTGEALTPPANLPLPTFAVEVRDGRVLLDPTPSHPHPLD